MPNLSCDVRNCSYNKDEMCSLNYIKVDGDDATNVEDTCCTNFDSSEYAASNSEHHVQCKVDIKCSAAGCVYNKDEECTAPEIKMSGATTASCSHDTQCASFWCK